MGALREKMVAEMKLRTSRRGRRSLTGGDGRVGQALSSVPGSIDSGTDPRLPLAFTGRGLSSSSQNVAVSGLKFFYQQVLGWDEQQLFFAPEKTELALTAGVKPEGSGTITELCGQAARSLFTDDCLLGGLRVGELVHLKLSDIHVERMMIRVEQGKGKKTATRFSPKGFWGS